MCRSGDMLADRQTQKYEKVPITVHFLFFFWQITGSSESPRLSYVSATAKHTVIHIIETITNNYKQTVFLTAGTVNT